MSETFRAYNANHCPACSEFRPCGASWVTPAEVIGQDHNESVMDSAGADCVRCGDDVPCWLGEGPSSCLLAVRDCRCACHRTWSTGARCLCCAPPAGWHHP